MPERLAHPHALRGYYATTLADQGVDIQQIKAGWGTPQSAAARYFAEVTDHSVGVGDILDRHRDAQRRGRSS